MFATVPLVEQRLPANLIEKLITLFFLLCLHVCAGGVCAMREQIPWFSPKAFSHPAALCGLVNVYTATDSAVLSTAG